MQRRLDFNQGRTAGGVRQTPPGDAARSVWLDLTEPGEQELGDALRPFALGRPPGNGRRRSGHPHLGVYDRCVEMTFMTPGGAPLTVYIGVSRVVTVHGRDAPEVEKVWQGYRSGAPDENRQSADMPLYRILETILDAYERDVERLIDRVEAVNLDPRSLRELSVLHKVIDLRRQALSLRRRIDPAVDLFGLLDARDFPFVPGGHRAYFEDLHERARGMAGDVDETRNLLAEDLEAFTSVQGQHANLVMKLFTILQVVFLPPTLIASIYGMNFKIPELSWPFGYAYSLTLMATTVVVLLLYVRSRGWLR